MKQWFMVLVSLILLSFIVVGCGDDDTKECPTCPSSQDDVTPKGFVTGTIYLDPETYIYDMWIFGYGAIPPNIDSMKVGDSLLVGEDFFDYEKTDDYHDNYWTVDFDEDGSNYMYHNGDAATIMFYGNGLNSTCHVKILNPDTAEIHIISPLTNADTVSSTDSATVVWNKSDGADYYSIWLECTIGQGYDEYDRYYYTLDTSFRVTPEMLPDSLRSFYVNVTPFTGPDPRTGASNITGDYLTGKVYSFGYSDYVQIIGWYPTIMAKMAGVVDIEEPPHKIVSPSEIVRNTYLQYQ
jgi:hypothetical protein